MSGVKRRTLTIGEKIEIIAAIEQGASNVSISRRLNLSSSTISTIWKKRDIITKAFERNKCNLKKLRSTGKNDLEEAIVGWFKLQMDTGVTVSAATFKQHAKFLASIHGYVITNAWLNRFRNRNGITYNKATGEMVVDAVLPESHIFKLDASYEESTLHETILASVDVEITEGLEEDIVKQEFTGLSEACTALETLTLFYERNSLDPQFLTHLNSIKGIIEKLTD